MRQLPDAARTPYPPTEQCALWPDKMRRIRHYEVAAGCGINAHPAYGNSAPLGLIRRCWSHQQQITGELTNRAGRRFSCPGAISSINVSATDPGQSRQFMTQAYARCTTMAASTPRLSPDLTRFNHPPKPTILYPTPLPEMPAQYPVIGATAIFSHWRFPTLWIVTIAVCCCHSGSKPSGFGGITIFSTYYRSPNCFLPTRPLALPAIVARPGCQADIAGKMLFQC